MVKLHPEILSVIAAHVGAVMITLTAANDWLKFGSLLLAMGYTVWRWQNDYKKEKKKTKRNG